MGYRFDIYAKTDVRKAGIEGYLYSEPGIFRPSDLDELFDSTEIPIKLKKGKKGNGFQVNEGDAIRTLKAETRKVLTKALRKELPEDVKKAFANLHSCLSDKC
ncbi:MAG: hypothetical protein GXY44_07475 [Phycisphaerales bacterium]|nr:hypothetical protein [Phycisphaerales bacterium]